MQKPPLNSSISLVIMYTASFILCVFFGAILKQVGTPGNYVNLMMFALVIGGYIFSGLFAKTMVLPVFQNAERTGRPFYIGQSIAAGVISSSVFIFLAGDLYATGTDALTLFSGLILGIALMSILFAAHINRSRTSTLTGLLTSDHISKPSRFLLLSIILITSMLLLYIQFSAIGLVSETYFNIPKNTSVIIAAIAIGFCLILGGIQSLTITRMISYPILIIAFLTPVIWIAYKLTGNPIPQLSFGAGALQSISEIDQELLSAGLVQQNDIFDMTHQGLNYDIFNHLGALLCIAFGTAAMPHLVQHFRILPKPASARKTGVWSLFFILIFLTAIPAVAAFVKLDIYTSLLGLQLSELEQEASWLLALNQGEASIISVCGAYITNASQALAACSESSDYFLSSNDIAVNPDMLLLSSGVLNELPDLMTTLLATGALLAIWSTADGLVFVSANALMEDGYHSLIRPKSPMGSRLFMSRFFIVVIIVFAAYLVLNFEVDRQFAFTSSFALLTAGLFPAMICRLWIKTIKQNDVIIGILLGTILTSTMLWLSHFGIDWIAMNGDEVVFNLPGITDKIQPLTMGIIGMVFSFISAFAICKLRKDKTEPVNTTEANSDAAA